MEISPGDRKHQIFKKGVAALKEAGIESPALDAAVLLGHVLGESPSVVLMDKGATLAASEAAQYSALVQKRCGRATVSRLVGSREFYSREFYVNEDVLDPRPETEVLVEEAIRFLEGLEGNPTVLDIGTGSGAIAVTVAAQIPKARITATDISMTALAVAMRNAERHAVQGQVNFIQADLLDGLREEGSFHAILSNPPYISSTEFENLPEDVRRGDPKIALVSGPRGTEYYPSLIANSMELLCPGGWLMVEVGTGQCGIVAGIFEHAGFAKVQTVNDLAGTGRVIKGRKNA